MKKTVRRGARAKAPAATRGKSVQAGPAAKARAKAAARAGKSTARSQHQVPPPVVAPAPVVPAAAPGPASDAFYLRLDASCTLRETADLQFSLVAATGDPVVVDGSAVERVDTAGLQLLVALAHRQRQGGRRLEWKAASPELLKCGERLGLTEALGLPAGAGATP
jgi:phospholipid transport system transporter-binding protein